MTIRNILLASAAVASLATGAHAQSVRQQQTAELLSPFTVLLNSDAGRTALQQNLAASIAVNNNADSARVARAISDNQIITDTGQQFTVALGSTLDQAYQKAISSNDAAFATSGAIVQTLRSFTSVSGGDSAFNKIFLANGTTDNVPGHNAQGINLPAGAQFNVYDKAYGPVAAPNPNGNSRPFQVAPTQIKGDQGRAAIQATLTTNSAIPSGHTTFGTTESLMEAIAVPERFSDEIARGMDYGYSRVVLGAHYAMDVIAGRILALHDVANMLNNNPDYTDGKDLAGQFKDFTTAFRGVLTKYAGTDIATAAKQDTGAYANKAQTAADVAYRLNYGIAPTGPTNKPAVVPAGAEVLLSTRFGYLTAAQRREVLATTELPSGYPLDDGSGWARLNLYAAGHGYGAFNGQTVVNQSGTGYGADADTWSNDIGGKGGLTHLGQGTLTLTGNNTYSGGTTIGEGTIVAGSKTALGTGDVLNSAGLTVGPDGLLVGGDFTQTSTGVLTLTNIGSALMTITGIASLDGSLILDFAGFAGGAGTYELISYKDQQGQFASVDYSHLFGLYGRNIEYRADGVYLSLSAVPEPASWAMMVGGFGLLGGTLRRRKRAVVRFG